MTDRLVTPTLQPVGRATIGDAVRRQALRQPRHRALVHRTPDGGRTELTYAQLADAAARFAGGLRDEGVGCGDRVAVLAPNGPEYVVAFLGALTIGAAVTGVGWRSPLSDVAWQVEHADAKVLVVGAARVAEIAAAELDLPDALQTFVALAPVGSNAPAGSLPEGWRSFATLLASDPVGPDDVDVTEHDLALLTYTSGSEQRPKGVLIPHRNYLLGTMPSLMAAGYVRSDDVYLFVKPFHTIAGLGSITSLLLAGSTLVLVDPPEPGAVLAAIEAERITTIAQTPTFYTALAHHERFATADLSSVRACHTYGGLVSRPMLQAFAWHAPHVRWASYWGQSELTQLGTIGWFGSFEDIPHGDPRWIGVPTPGLEVRIVDPDGNDVDTGELICRSPSVMAGYHKDPERTAETLRGGWVHTGDIVHRDGDGQLFFVDRVKDMIKTGGMNVSSLEVEDALLRHPAVLQAAVVGLPDAYWSEAVTAFVVGRPGGPPPDPDDVIAACKATLAPYKVPKRVVVLDQLPTDPQGKVRKRELRASHTSAL